MTDYTINQEHKYKICSFLPRSTPRAEDVIGWLSSTSLNSWSCLKFIHGFTHTLASYILLCPPSTASTVRWYIVPATTCSFASTTLPNSIKEFCSNGQVTIHILMHTIKLSPQSKEDLFLRIYIISFMQPPIIEIHQQQMLCYFKNKPGL